MESIYQFFNKMTKRLLLFSFIVAITTDFKVLSALALVGSLLCCYESVQALIEMRKEEKEKSGK